MPLAVPFQSRLYPAVLFVQAWGIGLAFHLIFGQAGVELGAEVAENKAWALPTFPTGVIAGDCPLALWPPLSWLTSSLGLMDGVRSAAAPACKVLV